LTAGISRSLKTSFPARIINRRWEAEVGLGVRPAGMVKPLQEGPHGAGASGGQIPKNAVGLNVQGGGDGFPPAFLDRLVDLVIS